LFLFYTAKIKFQMAKIKGKGFLFEIILPIPENVISLHHQI